MLKKTTADKVVAGDWILAPVYSKPARVERVTAGVKGVSFLINRDTVIFSNGCPVLIFCSDRAINKVT